MPPGVGADELALKNRRRGARDREASRLRYLAQLHMVGQAVLSALCSENRKYGLLRLPSCSPN